MAAKFRRNHGQNKSSSLGFVRILAFALILVFSLWYLSGMIGDLGTNNFIEKQNGRDGYPDHLHLVSQYKDVEIIDHKYFLLGYSEEHEQASWVSYELTEELLKEPNVERTDFFTEDPKVSTKSSHHRDYTGTGFTRGHLVPAGDMAFSTDAMEASFNMSNISPQLAAFNGGIWRELEELVRDWTYDHDALYIVTGPVLNGPRMANIGKTSRVTVPKYFFKAIMNKDFESIGFVMPNAMSVESVMSYAVTIDSLEKVLELELFDEIVDDEIEDVNEARFDKSLWKIDVKRFNRRIEDWNKR